MSTLCYDLVSSMHDTINTITLSLVVRCTGPPETSHSDRQAWELIPSLVELKVDIVRKDEDMAEPLPYDDDDEDDVYDDPSLAASSGEQPSDDPTAQAWAHADRHAAETAAASVDMRVPHGIAPATRPPRSVLEGWVLKEGSEWQSWRRRYLVLRQASATEAKAHDCTHLLLWFTDVPLRGESKCVHSFSSN